METFDPNMEEMKKAMRQKAGKAGRWMKHTGSVIFLAVLLLVLGNGSFYNIEEQEQAVVTTFGVAKAVTDPGLHFKIPLIQRVKKVNTTIQGFALGYSQDSNEVMEASRDPVQILRNVSQACIRTVIGGYDVDSVLTTGKTEIQGKIKEMMIGKLEQHDIGLQVVNVTIQDSEPPTTEVMEAFKAVETAKQGKETSINNANKYRNEKLPQAEAQIDQIMQEAEAAKARRVNEANGEVAKFNAMYAEYVKNPEVTRQRMFYEAMEDVLPGMKVIIDGTGQVNTMLPLDSFTQGQAGAAAPAPSQEAAQAAAEE